MIRPGCSPDGQWLVYGSKGDGVRQLYVMRLSDKQERRITDLTWGAGCDVAVVATRAAP